MIKRIHSTLLQSKDLDETSAFYQKIGFSVEVSKNGVRLIFGDYRLTFIKETDKNSACAKKGIGMSIFFEVDNVDDFYQEIKEKQLNPLNEPAGRPGGKRKFTVQDPDGYNLVFFTKTRL